MKAKNLKVGYKDYDAFFRPNTICGNDVGELLIYEKGKMIGYQTTKPSAFKTKEELYAWLKERVDKNA